MPSRATMPLVELVVLSLWLGASVFVSAAVAPSLFAVLPTRSLAGAVVGRLLPIVFYSGMIAGAVVLAGMFVDQRGWRWRGRESAGAVIILACAVAQFVILPRIERLRAEIGGPMDALPADDLRRAAFGRLHGLSVAWLGLAMLAAVVAMVLSARTIASRT